MPATDPSNGSNTSPKPRGLRLWTMRFMACALGTLAALAILELTLRALDPFSLRVHGSRISLPTNEVSVIQNDRIEKVDKEIRVTRNGIGFRGPDPPADFDEQLTIVAIGGSTTECYYLTDGATWPEQLAERLSDEFNPLWLNNAGLDGHSTFGHTMLLKSYLEPMRPKVILFLIGINDVGNESLTVYDGMPHVLPKRTALQQFGLFLAETYVTVQYFDTIRRGVQAKQKGLVHADMSHEQLKLLAENVIEVSEAKRKAALSEHSAKYLAGYRRRIEQLIETTRSCGSEPVLITQPALYGPGKDEPTGVDLGAIAVGELNGSAMWDILESYNDVTREVGRDEEVLVVDLAAEMPKNSDLYYDFLHFSNAGAKVVAEILADRLTPSLQTKFPPFRRNE